MLVLSRKVEEEIMAGSIRIKILDVRRSGAVKIGIEAPAGVPVHRMEVFNAIVNNTRQAWDRDDQQEPPCES